MYKSHRNRSLTNGGGHTFKAASAHVADREYTGEARFEEMWSSRERPMSGGKILGRQLRSRFDKPVCVQSDAPLEPLSVGNRARHDKDVAD